MARQVLVRIRRMGKNWATCGIGVRPPENMVGSPAIKYLCPKLVPGQVIRLPSDHPLLRNSKLIEIVNGPEEDEFVRPWVFANAEDAALADPSKSGLPAGRIAEGLALTQGAIQNQETKLRERSQGERPEDFDDDEAEDEDPAARPLRSDENARRSQNRSTADIYDDVRPVDDGEPEPDPEPVPSRRRRRSGS